MKRFVSHCIIILGLSGYFATEISGQSVYPWAEYHLNGSAEDNSGNYQDATLYGDVTLEAWLLEIGEDTSDYMAIPVQALNQLKDFTLTFQFTINNINNVGSTPSNTFINASSATNPREFAISYRFDINSFEISLHDSTYNCEVDITEDVTYCLVLKREGSDLKLFIDGILQANINATDLPLDISFIAVGQRLDCPGGCFSAGHTLNGSMDDIAIYPYLAYTYCYSDYRDCDTVMVYPLEVDANDNHYDGYQYNGTASDNASFSGGYLVVDHDTDSYVTIPDVAFMSGGDFAISLICRINAMNIASESSANTLFSIANYYNQDELTIAYNATKGGFECMVHDSIGLIPAILTPLTTYCVIIYRAKDSLWINLNGDELPTKLYMPTGGFHSEIFVIGQDADCSEGCFTTERSFNGNIRQFSIQACALAVQCDEFEPDHLSTIERHDLQVYPNPANGTLYIDLEGAETEQIQVSISTLNGQQVKTYTINNQQHTSIDISSISPGIYLLTASTSHRTNTLRLIIE